MVARSCGQHLECDLDLTGAYQCGLSHSLEVVEGATGGLWGAGWRLGSGGFMGGGGVDD